MGIAFVNGGYSDANSFALGWAQSSGNILVAFVTGLYSTAPTSISCSDSANGSYTDSGAGLKAANTVYIQAFYRNSIASASANSNTITATLSGGSGLNFPAVYVLEFSGQATSSPIDATNTGTGNNTAASMSLTTGNANDAVVDCFVNANNGWNGAGTGFTNALLDGNFGNISDYKIVSSTGTYTDTPSSLSSSEIWSGIILGIKAASSTVSLGSLTMSAALGIKPAPVLVGKMPGLTMSAALGIKPAPVLVGKMPSVILQAALGIVSATIGKLLISGPVNLRANLGIMPGPTLTGGTMIAALPYSFWGGGHS